MPDLSFASFNSRSFEQFSQALAANVLGHGIFIFGDGPDGGREAAFEGKTPYPTPSDSWDGYIVMQAKFRQTTSDGAKDPEWLVGQLKAEMDKFVGNPDRRVPDYYLLITNVRLSGVSSNKRKGGQQKVDEAFERLCKPLGIRHLEVWHAERIGVLIDGQPDLHRSYEAWLTPREVLSAAYRFFNARNPDFGAIMGRYLQREFRTQRDTRLREAGHVGDGGPSLEDVFVDLPCFGDALDPDSRALLAPAGAAPPGEVPLVVESLLGRLALKLDPTTLVETWPASNLAGPSRHLLLGGPGQGKSTVSQFLGQVARWRLLAAESRPSLSPDTLRPLDNFGQRATELGIGADGVRRYPIRVDLPNFADAVDKNARNNKRLSLLAYITHHISQTADAEVAIEDVRGWLRAYPWLLLLDGLDEVPPSGNRKAVLGAITDFWDEAVPLKADVAMIVTSRPQGYHDDLDPRLYLKLELTQLDRERALSYAERLALLRLVDPERRKRVLDRLNAAAASPATAALMVSPLQVAILFQLVDQRGQAPTDRWSLFHEYLGTVMKREQEKPGASGETMRRWTRQVHTLVRRAGLLLHTSAEADGAASSHLSVEQLADLVCDLLREDGHTEDEAASIANEVIVATTDRLAFLEQREEGRYAFEVRSLQEYAAAAALMAGKEADIIRRLKTIAGYAHWQHVYRIAASKAFSDPDAEIFRETIVGINRGLDDSDVAARATRLGAQISLSLVEDSLATDQPTYRRQLVTHSMEIVRQGRSPALSRLVDPLIDLGEDFARPLLAEAISSGTKAHREAGWQLLFTLTSKATWAIDLIDEWRPSEPGPLVEAIASLEDSTAQPCFDMLAVSGLEIPVKLIANALSRRAVGRTGSDNSDFFELIPAFAVTKSRTIRKAREVAVLDNARSMRLCLNTLDETRKTEWWSSPHASSWKLTPLVRGFMINPSPASLAEFAAGLSKDACDEASHLALPWMLDTLVTLARGSDVKALARQAASGDFGQPDCWVAAERRLVKDGITSADLELWSEGIFFDSRIATIGAPHFPAVRRTLTPHQASWAEPLLRAAIAAPEGPVRELLRFLLGLAIVDNGLRHISAQELLASLLSSPSRWLQPLWLRKVPIGELDSPALLDSLRTFAREARISLGGNPDVSETEKKLVRLAAELSDPSLFVIAVSSLGNMPEYLFDVATDLRDVAHLAITQPNTDEQSLAIPVLVSVGDINAADALKAVLAKDKETCGMHTLFNLAKTNRLDESLRQHLLAGGLDRLDDISADQYIEVSDELNRMLDSRRTNLHSRETWDTLNLPASIFERFRIMQAKYPNKALS